MAEQKILVPDMGDFKDVEIIEVLVKEGQDIKKNDSIITLESDKSSVEVPSTYEGVVEKINVKVGDKVNQGDLILNLKTKDFPKEIKKIIKKPPESKKTIVINKEINKLEENIPDLDKTSVNVNKLASPKVRKFARELGANVSEIPGTQRAGRVSEEDVKSFVKSQVTINKGKIEKKTYKEQFAHQLRLSSPVQSQSQHQLHGQRFQALPCY